MHLFMPSGLRLVPPFAWEEAPKTNYQKKLESKCNTKNGIPRVSFADGTLVLGVPIGSNEFIAKHIDDVCAELAHLAKRIGLLKSSIAKFLLLRACFGACRINHLLRSLPFESGRSLSEKTAIIVRDTLGKILGSALPDLNYELACLTVRRGGLGIRNPRLVFGPAFLASNLAFGSAQEELPEQFWRELLGAWRVIQPDLHLNAASLANIEALDSVEPEDIDAAWLKQNWWQAQVNTQLEVHFKLNAPPPPRKSISSMPGKQNSTIHVCRRRISS